MPNKRTGQDYLDREPKKKKTPDWADLRERIRKDKEKQKKNRKTLPHKI